MGEGGKPFVAWGPVLPTALALGSLGVFEPLDVAGPAATPEAKYASIAAREPEVRAHFDVYAERRTLHWLREPCAPSDVEPKFVLHLVPADRGDLPRERRRHGFDNLDFWFRDRGVRFGERCMASVGLPDYGIARVRVGQWLPAEGRNLWQTEFAFAE